MNINQVTPLTETVPTGEFVNINGQTAMIISMLKVAGKETYKVRFSNGNYESGFTKNKISFPLASYKRQGCIESDNWQLCVGDAVYVNQTLATIMGYNDSDLLDIKYALKFTTGIVNAGYTKAMLSL